MDGETFKYTNPCEEGELPFKGIFVDFEKELTWENTEEELVKRYHDMRSVH